MTILCYHTVDDGWTSPLAVSVDDFARQCAWLASTGRVVPLDVVTARTDRRGRPPTRPIAITFDDGFRGVYEHAMASLERHRLPATVFLVAETLAPAGRRVDWVDTPPPWPLRTLTLEHVLEMQERGVTFGSHSYSHHDLRELGDVECERDLRASKDLLEELLGHPVPALAYPRGFHNEKVRRAAARAGYRAAFALPEGREPTGVFSVPRVGVHGGNGLAALRVKCLPGYLAARTSGVYRASRRMLRRPVAAPTGA